MVSGCLWTWPPNMSAPHTDEALTENHEMDVEGDYNDDEGEYDEGEDGLFDDEDAEEAAEAVAKQLGDALWADISKAYAQQESSQPAKTPGSLPQPPSPRSPSPSFSEERDDEETLANAVQLVLDLSSSQPPLYQILSKTLVPQAQDDTLLEVLTKLAETKTVTSELAESLSCLVQSVADSHPYDMSKKEVLSGPDQSAVEARDSGQARMASLEVE
ncbi:hypothetical protein JB92DRAFT_3142119 [Gautieria morchelliformis]|nr:hypothetical protein JB92DRAFT_3142119 [Gautieria morchelliformis]